MTRLASSFGLAALGLAAAASAPASTPPLRGDPAVAPWFADVTLATGVRLRYAEQGDPDGPAVILLHGYSDSWFSWSRILPAIPARYHVIAPDLRGHGDSDRPAGGYAMRELAADVLALMDARGIRRASVVGHSMGSFVAQQVALAAPERVDRLVLVGSAPSIRGMSGIAEFTAAVNALEDPVSQRFAREFQESTIHYPVPDEFVDSAVAGSLRLPARVWRSIMAGMLATPPAEGLGRLGIPTLVIFGQEDAVFPRPAQEALLAALPEARRVAYPATGHAPHWERPEVFVRDLVGFLPGGPGRY